MPEKSIDILQSLPSRFVNLMSMCDIYGKNCLYNLKGGTNEGF